MSDDVMLTTLDNPFNPFDQFDSWFMFDIEKGYYTCSRLARVTANMPEDLSEKEESEEIEKAIDDIIKYDVFNVYKKVSRRDNTASVPA